jgi:hypothetical protein
MYSSHGIELFIALFFIHEGLDRCLSEDRGHLKSQNLEVNMKSALEIDHEKIVHDFLVWIYLAIYIHYNF